MFVMMLRSDGCNWRYRSDRLYRLPRWSRCDRRYWSHGIARS